jgi:hypothetical protein
MNTSQVISIWLLGWVAGIGTAFWLVGNRTIRSHQRRVLTPPAYDWRRRFSHENFNRPTGEPPLKLKKTRRAA